MDSSRSKRRSFSKSKLIRSLYRAATKPSGGKPASADFAANQPIKPKPPTMGGFIIVNQEQVFGQHTPKLAFVVADRNRDSYGKLENFYEDEGVDDKAARYISSVQERFRLERVNSERKKLEDIRVCE